MRTSALARVAAATAAALATTILGVGAGAAYADEPAPPVVVADTVTLYPGQTDTIDVLANDSSPIGDDLALCRFPESDFMGEKFPSVVVTHSSFFTDGEPGPGDVTVLVMPRAHGTHVVDYFVCDHTHLVPAKLTVVVHDVTPVKVRKVAGKPGRLRVSNDNDEAVRFLFGDRRADRADGKVLIPAHSARTVRVQRHRILWVALIGAAPGKAGLMAMPGIAGHGVVRHIKLRGEPLPAPKPHKPPKHDYASESDVVPRLWLR